MPDWKEFLTEIGNPLIDKSKEEIQDFLSELAADGEAVLKEHGNRITQYLTWLASGTISKEQFYGLMLDTKALLAGAVRVEQAEAKKRSREFAKKISFEVFGALLTAL